MESSTLIKKLFYEKVLDYHTKITSDRECPEESILLGFQMNGEDFDASNFCTLSGKLEIYHKVVL